MEFNCSTCIKLDYIYMTLDIFNGFIQCNIQIVHIESKAEDQGSEDLFSVFMRSEYRNGLYSLSTSQLTGNERNTKDYRATITYCLQYANLI